MNLLCSFSLKTLKTEWDNIPQEHYRNTLWSYYHLLIMNWTWGRSRGRGRSRGHVRGRGHRRAGQLYPYL